MELREDAALAPPAHRTLADCDLSGADSWAAVAMWGRAKRDWLRQCLPFTNGVASHDTFGRVLALLNAAVFERCFIAWIRAVCGAFEGLQVALDGQTVGRSPASGQKTIHVLSAFAQSAFAHGLGLTLGQVKTAEKSNEITAIPELLDALLPKGCLVTIDAMGCQKAIAAKLIQPECDYALLVKNNRGGDRRRLRGGRPGRLRGCAHPCRRDRKGPWAPRDAAWRRHRRRDWPVRPAARLAGREDPDADRIQS